MIAPGPPNPENGFDIGGDVGCGEYFTANVQQSLGDLDTYPPMPQRWRLSTWFRGTADGTIFELQGIQLTMRSGTLWVTRTGAPLSTYSTSLNAGDGAWHGVALEVDATTTPLSIKVFVDAAQNQSPTTLSWALDVASTYLFIGAKLDPTARGYDFDEVCVFF